jgi:hypothetical protein
MELRHIQELYILMLEMTHMHYSPFQWATSVQASENQVGVKKILKSLNKLTKKDTAKAKIIPTTMTREQAHSIPGTPTAFISPNSIDGMRSVKSVFGC